jgi:hypothetical protein
MRAAVPPLMDHTDALQHRRQREHDGHQKPRPQRLYCLASAPADARPEVAQPLGVHRHTLGRGLARYASGGLAVLLAPYTSAGKSISLAPAVLAGHEQARHRAAGFAFDEALRPWVRQTHGVEVKDKTLYKPECVRCKAERNVARPRRTTTS